MTILYMDQQQVKLKGAFQGQSKVHKRGERCQLGGSEEEVGKQEKRAYRFTLLSESSLKMRHCCILNLVYFGFTPPCY